VKKFDWKKEYKDLYFPNDKVRDVKVPKMNFLMIDGAGDPNENPQFSDAVAALYSISYTIKFALKKTGGPEYSVMPMEGLWWAPDMNIFIEHPEDKSTWLWTIMIAQPDFIKESDFKQAADTAFAKKKMEAIKHVRFEAYDEGKAVQMLHFGPYSEEGKNILKLHEFIEDNGWKLSGKHHEIYLSDARRVAPEKMKTVIRQPYKQ
jgi:hypothetical protein